MIRTYDKAYGDNAGAYATVSMPTVFGSGQVHIPLGWKPSVSLVAFSRLFDEKAKVVAEYDPTDYEDPDLWVGYYNEYTAEFDDPFTSTGFWVQYRNIPELDGDSNPLGLNFNYICLP